MICLVAIKRKSSSGGMEEVGSGRRGYGATRAGEWGVYIHVRMAGGETSRGDGHAGEC